MSQFFKCVLFSVFFVILVFYLILGLKLCIVGIKFEVFGVDVQIFWIIVVVVLIMFVWQLFCDCILFKLGCGVGYKVNGSGLKNFFSLLLIQCWVVFVLVVVVFVWLFFVLCGVVDIVILILIYVMFGIGLNIVVGLVGLFDFGYVGFYVVGVYIYVLFVEYVGFGFWIVLLIVGMMVVLFGFFFGFLVLCLCGDYLVIVIFGFGEIICILLCNMIEIIGGFNGIGLIFKLILFGLIFECCVLEGMQIFYEFFGIVYNINYKVILFYVVVLLLVLLVLFVINWLMCMLIGCVWEVLCEDEVVCCVFGFNLIIVKFFVFIIGVSFVGFVGSFFVVCQGLVMFEFFIFIELVMIFVIVVFGGMGLQFGVIFVVVVMVLFQEMCGFNEYCMLIFGLIMIVMMIWCFQGLLLM